MRNKSCGPEMYCYQYDSKLYSEILPNHLVNPPFVDVVGVSGLVGEPSVTITYNDTGDNVSAFSEDNNAVDFNLTDYHKKVLLELRQKFPTATV